MKLRHLSAFAIAATALFTLSACESTPMEVSATPVPGASFGGKKTFSWAADAGSSLTAGGVQDSTGLDAHVRSAVASQLTAKGYQEAASGGDFIVTYQASAVDESVTDKRVGEANENFEMTGGLGFDSSVPGGFVDTSMPQDLKAAADIKRDGSIMVQMSDPAGKIMWTGSAHTMLSTNESSGARNGKVDRAVTEMFASFPASN